jgi:fatty-acyl-CoA synthase
MQALNLHPSHLYGLTETYGPHMSCTAHPEWEELPVEEQAALLARQGQTYNGSDLVRVVDEELRDVPADGATLGEIVMRGNSVTAGYWNREEETAEAFRGRLVPLRRPRRHASRRLRRAARPQEGRDHLGRREHLERRDRAGPGPAPRGLRGGGGRHARRDVGRAAEGLRRAAADAAADEAELLEFCREHLRRFKCPAAIAFGELPRTSTGRCRSSSSATASGPAARRRSSRAPRRTVGLLCSP